RHPERRAAVPAASRSRRTSSIRIDMRVPDGVTYSNKGAYHEIAENERLVFTLQTFDAGGNSMAEVVITVAFAEVDAKTRVKVNGGEPAVLYCWTWLYIAAQGPGAWALDNLLFRKRTT